MKTSFPLHHPLAILSRGLRLGTYVCATVVTTLLVSPLQGGIAGEIIERLIRIGGHTVDDAGRIAAREALEKGLAKYGDEVVELTERGGFGLAESAARHGDDVWRLARLSPEAPRALAGRAESLLAIASRSGDDAVKLEIRAPACGEVLAGSLSKRSLAKLADKASVPEIQRFAAMAAHGSPRELEAAVAVWNRSGGRVLKYLTPARIASLGFAGALVTAAWGAPEAMMGLTEVALKGFLGPLVTICSWMLVLLVLTYLRGPLLWLAKRTANLGPAMLRSIGIVTPRYRLEGRHRENSQKPVTKSSKMPASGVELPVRNSPPQDPNTNN